MKQIGWLLARFEHFVENWRYPKTSVSFKSNTTYDVESILKAEHKVTDKVYFDINLGTVIVDMAPRLLADLFIKIAVNK